MATAGDGIAGRGQAYGVRSLRVDGNDTLAMYSAMKAAREMAVTEERPILLEVRSVAGSQRLCLLQSLCLCTSKGCQRNAGSQLLSLWY